jgi:hypothetical protein
MKAKLIKLELNEGYRLDDEKGNLIASTLDGAKTKLSHTNCDDIFGVIDVEKLAKKYLDSRYDNEDIAHPELYEEYNSFIVGFNKRAELNKDKVFSEEQMFRMFLFGHSLSEAIKRGVIEDKPVGEIFDDRIKFIQQPTEIEVEIEMAHYVKYVPKTLETVYPTRGVRPKLDSNGCLILKRVI